MIRKPKNLEGDSKSETSFIACARRRISGCRFSPFRAERSDNRKYVCERRLLVSVLFDFFYLRNI